MEKSRYKRERDREWSREEFLLGFRAGALAVGTVAAVLLTVFFIAL